ncbi:TetR family transcriptional regulator [Amycolatopsis antarctica]|uniref:TetR family transcriptional regulator n=1 Tax=Amycolatopsis antarctica TaxID=1854586 RepID=A0A263DAA0_9PSEU|nr:TetR/AcrR family transcriptional regulator [Amycolatopsis antarctica]OZM74457.1 TetR family transcriptional regulator [Amycolatopsis antarctica]
MAAGTDPSKAPRRPWRGVGADERQSRRREQLIDAAFAVLGAEGAAAVTMRGVCREAKLTERYFYENFASRADLLVAVLEATTASARDTLIASLDEGPSEFHALIRHAVRAFTGFVTADPRRGRVLFVESMAAPELTTRAIELVDEFTVTIAGALRGSRPGGDDLDVELNSQAVFGALAFLYQVWLERRVALPVDRFVEHVSQVIEHLGQASSAPAGG